MSSAPAIASQDVETQVRELAEGARAASHRLALVDSGTKNRALTAAAAAVRAAAPAILEANAKDAAFGREKGLSNAMIDRLLLTDEILMVRAAAARSLSTLPAEMFSPVDAAAVGAALEDLKSIQRANADRPESHIVLGALHAQTGELDEALAACNVVPPPNFVVYFGFDKSNLDAAARGVLYEVVAAISEFGTTALSLVGHADTVASVAYNQGLSEARARRVAKQLAAHGVPPGAMTLAGRSENDLAVATGDNVREPLNRRVEIVLSD